MWTSTWSAGQTDSLPPLICRASLRWGNWELGVPWSAEGRSGVKCPSRWDCRREARRAQPGGTPSPAALQAPNQLQAACCPGPQQPAVPDRAHHVCAGGVFPVRLVRDKPVKYCCPYILMPTSLKAWAPGPLALLRGSPTATQFPAPPQGRLPLQPPLVHGGECVTHTHTHCLL